MKEWNPDARRYSAQAFGIPESTVLIYDELQRLRKRHDRQQLALLSWPWHTHLGQLMTYASGLEAVTIVWITSGRTAAISKPTTLEGVCSHYAAAKATHFPDRE